MAGPRYFWRSFRPEPRICPGGGIGRHEGLKIPWPVRAVRVRAPPWVRFGIVQPPIRRKPGMACAVLMKLRGNLLAMHPVPVSPKPSAKAVSPWCGLLLLDHVERALGPVLKQRPGHKKKPLRVKRLFGAGNETRTRDPNLGKVVLYQLSYSRLVANGRAC